MISRPNKKWLTKSSLKSKFKKCFSWSSSSKCSSSTTRTKVMKRLMTSTRCIIFTHSRNASVSQNRMLIWLLTLVSASTPSLVAKRLFAIPWQTLPRASSLTLSIVLCGLPYKTVVGQQGPKLERNKSQFKDHILQSRGSQRRVTNSSSRHSRIGQIDKTGIRKAQQPNRLPPKTLGQLGNNRLKNETQGARKVGWIQSLICHRTTSMPWSNWCRSRSRKRVRCRCSMKNSWVS